MLPPPTRLLTSDNSSCLCLEEAPTPETVKMTAPLVLSTCSSIDTLTSEGATLTPVAALSDAAREAESAACRAPTLLLLRAGMPE